MAWNRCKIKKTPNTYAYTDINTWDNLYYIPTTTIHMHNFAFCQCDRFEMVSERNANKTSRARNRQSYNNNDTSQRSKMSRMANGGVCVRFGHRVYRFFLSNFIFCVRKSMFINIRFRFCVVGLFAFSTGALFFLVVLSFLWEWVRYKAPECRGEHEIRIWYEIQIFAW